MTYKHVQFSDSVVMRSLERVAQEKGLIKPAPLAQKTAAKKTDLTPSVNLTDNMLKLCAGLRERGFDKQANELETNLINYKKAQTLYETSPEKGEDLVHAAHPKGSHKLEGVESDEAVFEDILDQYAKSLEVVNKKPTGKLSSAQEGIKAVMVALGAPFLSLAQDSLNDLYAKALSDLEGFRRIKAVILTKLDDPSEATISDRWLAEIETRLTNKDVYGERNFENSLIQALNSIQGEEEPGFFSTERTKRTWNDEIMPLFVELKTYADDFYGIIAKIHNKESAAKTEAIKQQYSPQNEAKPTATAPASDPVTQKYKDTINTIGRLKARIQAKGMPNSAALIGWLDNQALPFATKNLEEFSKSQYKDDQQVIASYLDKVDNVLQPRLNAFQQKWSI